MKNLLLSIILIMTTFPITSCAESSDTKTKIEKLIYYSKKGLIEVELTISQPQAEDSIKYINVWGYDQYPLSYKKEFKYEPPDNAITNIEIMLNNKKILVPLSAYCDLTNYKKSRIIENKGFYILIIEGGNESTSYKALIYFDDNYVRRRNVHSLSFPDSSWDETIYTVNELDN